MRRGSRVKGRQRWGVEGQGAEKGDRAQGPGQGGGVTEMKPSLLLLSVVDSICLSVFSLDAHKTSGGSDSRESACNEGDLGLIPGLGRSPRGGHSNPLHYSCLDNPMDRGAWQTVVHRVAQSQTWLKRLSMHVGMGLEQRLAPTCPEGDFSFN